MGSDIHASKPAPGSRSPIAAFDFDGTLTVHDSFTDYLRWRTPVAKRLTGAVRLLPALIRYLVHRDRGDLKAAAVRILLADLTGPEMTAEANRFCALRFDALMRPDALRCWEDYGRRGFARIIVTASPELLVQPFALRLGADRLLGTRLKPRRDGQIEGIEGENCRGAEKVRRLEQAYGPDVRLEAAYGDTAGDREMLALAIHPGFRAFRERP